MSNLKITPIDIEPSTTVSGIGKNITEVVAFQIALANDLNRVIAEINSNIDSNADTTEEIEEESVDTVYSTLRQYIIQCEDRIQSLEKSLSELITAQESNKKEIDSNREEYGYAIDAINQKLMLKEDVE